MQEKISNISVLIKAKPLYASVLLVLFLILFFVFFGRGGGEGGEAVIVVPKDFRSQISVSGKVVSAEDVDLGFSQSGRVSRVYVSIGDMVYRGQVLAETENADLRAAVAQKEAAYEKEMARLISLEGGTRPEQIAVTESNVLSAKAALLEEIKDAYRSSDDAVRNKADQFFSNPSVSPNLNFYISNSQLEIVVEEGRTSVERVLSDWQKSFFPQSADQYDLIPIAHLSLSNLNFISKYLSDVSAALNSAVTSATLTQATVDAYKADVATGRSNVNSAASSLSSAITALDTAQKKLELELAGSTASEINIQKATVNASLADIDAATAALGKTIIRAPFSGVITDVPAKVGKIISSNEVAVSMINNEIFQVESFVPEINVASLEVGDLGVITLDAYGDKTFFNVRVVSIDPAETIKDGVPTYRAVLQFEEADKRIRAGMTANASIVTEEKSGVLSVPVNTVFGKNGKKYVWVKNEEGKEEREVWVGGISYLGEIEVLSGLVEGDIVVIPKSR